MSKTLVVYYSLDGNTRLIAETAAEALGADILRLEPVRDVPRQGFLKYFVGGMKASLRMKIRLRPYALDPADYDKVLIGSPVWGGAMAPAVRTFLSGYDWTGKKMAFVVCSGGESEKTLATFEPLVRGAVVLGGLNFVSPLRTDEKAAVERIKREAVRLFGIGK